MHYDVQVPAIPDAGTARQQWLSLGEASEFLGIHYTTLRSWADNGDIPVFRTPGGHRRFSVSDLRRFLAERASSVPATDSTALVDVALGRVREQLQQQRMTWLARDSADEADRDVQRERGRQLFSLAVSYVMKPGQRERIIEDGRRLGWEYGQEAALTGITLSATGRTVQFFRRQLNDAVSDTTDGLDAEDVKIQALLNQFLDEVLYAVLDGFEQTTGLTDDAIVPE